jgi:hypothetical protein
MAMNDADSDDLLSLCEAILEDDEVSVDEVRSLGEWLTQHEAARMSWPGDVLTSPLEQVLLDGRVNKAELRKISTLLRRVHKEAVARSEQKVQQDAIASAARAATELDLFMARLPSVRVTLRVMSQSERGVAYDVDLTGPSCSCPDWRTWRSALPPGDPTRCCKHTFDAFSRVRPEGGWPGWLDAFLEQGWRADPQTRWRVLEVSGRQVLASTAPRDWANVFAPGPVRYQRFGFNVVERRWSYGVEPDGAAMIANSILAGLSAPASSTQSMQPPSTPSRSGGVMASLRRLLGG